MINDYVVLGELPSSFADYVSYGLIGLTAVILLRFAQTLALIQYYNWKATRDIAVLEKRRLQMKQGFSVSMNKEDDIKKSSIQNGILVTFQVRQRQQLEKLQKRTKRALELQRDIVQAGTGISNRTNLEMLQMLNDYHEAISTGVEVSRLTRSKRIIGESKNDDNDSDSEYEEDAMYQQLRVNKSAPAEQSRGLFSLSSLSMRGKSITANGDNVNQKIKQRKLKELQLIQAKELEDLKASQLPPEVLERLKRSHDLLTLGIMHRADGRRLRYKSLKNQPEHVQVSEDRFIIDASNGPLLEILEEWHEEDRDHMLNVNEDDERIFKPFSRNVGLQADPTDDPNFFERAEISNHRDWMKMQSVQALENADSSDDDSEDQSDNENVHSSTSPKNRGESTQSVGDNLRSLADAIFGTSLNNKGVDTKDFGGVPFRSTGSNKKNPLARSKVTVNNLATSASTPTSSKSFLKRKLVSPGGVSEFVGGIRVVSSASRLRASSSDSRHSPTEISDVDKPVGASSIIGRLRHLASSASNRVASSPPSTSRNALSVRKIDEQLQGQDDIQGKFNLSSLKTAADVSLIKAMNPLAKKKESYDPQPIMTSNIPHPALSDLNINFEESSVFENPMLMNSRNVLVRGANPLSKGRRDLQLPEPSFSPGPSLSLQRLQNVRKFGTITLELSNVNFAKLIEDKNLLSVTETSLTRVIASLGGVSPDSVRTIEIKNGLSSVFTVRFVFPEEAQRQLEAYLGVRGESASKELICSCIPVSVIFDEDLPVTMKGASFDVITKEHADAVSRTASLSIMNRVTGKSSGSEAGDDPTSVSIALSLNDISENSSFRSRGSTFESLSSFASDFPSLPPSLGSSSLTPSAIAVSIDYQQPTVSVKSNLKGLKALKASISSAPSNSSTPDVFVEADLVLDSAQPSAQKSTLSGLKALKASKKL